MVNKVLLIFFYMFVFSFLRFHCSLGAVTMGVLTGRDAAGGLA